MYTYQTNKILHSWDILDLIVLVCSHINMIALLHRFYQGRRSADDERQIGRWLRCAGDTGRWRGNLISKCVKSGCGYDNMGVSPVVRQTLQHWAYKLTKEDFEAGVKKMKKKGLA